MNTNFLYHILYSTLCSANYKLSHVYFIFSFKTLAIFLMKIKQICDKLWLIEHKVEHKNHYLHETRFYKDWVPWVFCHNGTSWRGFSKNNKIIIIK